MFSKNWGFYIMIFEDEASFSNKEQKPKTIGKVSIDKHNFIL